MHLIDKQDGIFFCGQLFDDLFDAFFKFAAVFGACDHAGQVKRDQPLIPQRLGYIAGNDFLRQTLDNSGFAHTRITDQCRIVFGAAGQNLDHALDLLIPSDDRIELAFFGGSGQIAAKLAERIIGCAAGSGAAVLVGKAALLRTA